MDALILAGGKGTRLAPFHTAKPLVQINGVSIVEHLIRHIEPHVERIVICTGYRASDVRAALAGRNVLFSDAGEHATMVERLLRAREEHGIGGRALLLYGDHLADVNIQSLVARHGTHASNRRTAITFAGYKHVLPFGVVRENDYQIRICNDETVVINIGFVVADPSCWQYARKEDGLAEWINCVGDNGGSVSCFVHEGKNASVNNHAELLAAEQVWR